MLFPTHYTSKPPVGAQLTRGHPLAKGLVGAWLFNEGSGLKAFDLSGNENQGSLNGGVSRKPRGLEFNGTSGYINCGNNEILRPNIFTAVMWLKTTETADNPTVMFGDWIPGLYVPSTNSRSLISLGNENYRYFNNVPTDILDGEYHQIAFVITGNGQNDIDNSKMYVDGEEQTVYSTSNSGLPVSKTLFRIGKYGGGYWFNGSIREIMIYNRILSTSEIKQLYYDPYCIFAQPMEAELFYAYIPYPHLSGLSGGISEAITGGIGR